MRFKRTKIKGGGEDRLLVSDFINEGGNVFIPGLDASATFLNNDSRCVCWCVCIWTRRWRSPIPSGGSLTGPSYRAASLSRNPTGQQPSWRPILPCQHNPHIWPTICSPNPNERWEGNDWNNTKTLKRRNWKKKCCFFAIREAKRRTITR